jgi:hypothetical protein
MIRSPRAQPRARRGSLRVDARQDEGAPSTEDVKPAPAKLSTLRANETNATAIVAAGDDGESPEHDSIGQTSHERRFSNPNAMPEHADCADKSFTSRDEAAERRVGATRLSK